MIEEKVQLKNAHGHTIIGVFSRPVAEKNKPEPVVIICNSFTATKDGSTAKKIAEMLHKQGIATLRFDFHGRGESEGKLEETTLSEAADDLKTVINFVAGLETTGTIGVWGYSFGAMAVLAVADKRVEISVLVAPVSDPLQVWNTEGDYANWKTQGWVNYWGEVKLNYSYYEDLQKWDLYANAKKLNGFTLIIHGKDDEIVPFEQSQKLFAVLPAGKEMAALKGCNHHFERQEDVNEMFNQSADWFVQKFKELI